MSYYNKCDFCGANLDPGEKCDCEVERNAKRLYLHKSKEREEIQLQGIKRTDSDRNRSNIRGNGFIPGLLLSMAYDKVKEAPKAKGLLSQKQRCTDRLHSI